MAEITILVPVLSRPGNVRPLVESIRATSDADILFLGSPNFRDEEQAILEVGCDLMVTPRQSKGDYARKINHGLRATDTPYVFLGADDIRFHPGWQEATLGAIAPDGICGTDDMGSPRVVAGEHSTHTLVSRLYAQEVGVLGQIKEPLSVLCELYWHEFVDDELVNTAKFMNRWAFADGAKVEHLHPNWGKAKPDPIYFEQRSRFRAGKLIYKKREYLWT